MTQPTREFNPYPATRPAVEGWYEIQRSPYDDDYRIKVTHVASYWNGADWEELHHWTEYHPSPRPEPKFVYGWRPLRDCEDVAAISNEVK